ncbi:hypothetical protein [Chlamydiifrater phoenicopteri]|uniref:hypothetical protein n=1 Tax=Chlamydiifrater phoenicopteri TaxID=2681469 RepID=UPI001BCEE3F2|nr:hypothetical protein [Chlamydiifrater phoenicopteri]
MSSPTSSQFQPPYSSQLPLPPSSVETKIKQNLSEIQKLLNQPPFDSSETERTLSDQFSSILSLGYSHHSIARSLTIHNISIKTLLQNKLSLTSPQYNDILSACKDFSEASCSYETPEKKPRLETESSSPPLEKTSLTERSCLLPFPTLKPASPQQKINKGKSSLAFLLDTIIKNDAKGSRQIQCPNKGDKEHSGGHICATCSLTVKMLYHGKRSLTKQILEFLKHTNKETLIASIEQLSFEEKGTFDKKYLSSLEVTQLINKCGIGDSVCLPNTKNPASQLSIYESVKNIVDAGTNDATTLCILGVWKNSSSLNLSSLEEREGLVVLRGQQFCLVSPESLSYIFMHLEQYTYHNGVRGQRHAISKEQALFLAKSTFYTMHAILLSPKVKSHSESLQVRTALSWKLVQHIFSLILAISSGRKLAVLPCKIPTPPEDLGFSDQRAVHLLAAFQSFVERNRLLPQ